MSPEIYQNFVKISEKTEQLQNVFKEQYASKQLKFLADKVKSFIPESVPSNEVESNDEKLETKEMQKEASEGNCVLTEPTTAEEVEEEVKVPEISSKRVLSLAPPTSCETMKKLKLYNSPLEYLRDNGRSKYV